MYYFHRWRLILIYEAAHSGDMAPECPSCDRQFDSERGVRVHHAHAHGDPLPNRECAACGTEFYSEYERKYCSDDCREEAVSRAGEDNPNYSGAKQKTSCEQCETSSSTTPRRSRGGSVASASKRAGGDTPCGSPVRAVHGTTVAKSRLPVTPVGVGSNAIRTR